MKVIHKPTRQEKEQYINDPNAIARITRLLNDPEYASQPDDDPRNPWVTNKQALRGNISRFDAMGLQLFSLLDDGTIKSPMPKEIELLVQRFLENSVGNTKLNSFLWQEALQHMDFSNSYISFDSIDFICEFSFRTRNFGQENSVQKLHRLHNAVISGNPVPDQDKFSFKELSVALDLTKIYMLSKPYIRDLPYITDLIKGSTKLENIYRSSIEVRKILDQMEQESNQDVQQLGPGVVVLEHWRKLMDLRGINMSPRIRAMNFITQYGHTTMLDLKQNQAMLSGIPDDTRGFKSVKFDIISQLHSDMYKMDPVALIPKEYHQLLEQVYGENWQLKVASKFKIIENEMYTNGVTRFSGLVINVEKLENAAGIASIIPFGHKKLEPNDFEELHKDVMIRGKYKKDSGIICSSFCAISIATSLVELDKQIKKDINSSRLAPDPKKINALNIVNIPFGKHEDLSKIHPERLVEILKGYNCVQPVQSKVVENYIKEADRVSQNAKKHIAHTTEVPKEKAVDRVLQTRGPAIQSRL